MSYLGRSGGLGGLADDNGDELGWAGPALGGYGGGPAHMGSIPMDELSGAQCEGCGGDQIGYYGDYPDHELIGHYCPECEAGRTGGLDRASYDLGYAQALEDLGYHRAPPGSGGGGVGGYGEYPEVEPMGYAGHAGGEMSGYVRDVEPPFNPRGDFGDQLAGYERERTVNPTCEIREEITPTSPSQVPGFFKPHF